MSTPEQRAEWREYRAARKARALANKRCTRCHKRHPRPGRKMCVICAGSARIRIATRRAKAIASGVCICCAAAPAIGVFCQACLAKHNSYDRKRRAQAKIDGVCISCFHNPPAPGLFSCRGCIERVSASNKARKLARKETTK